MFTKWRWRVLAAVVLGSFPYVLVAVWYNWLLWFFVPEPWMGWQAHIELLHWLLMVFDPLYLFGIGPQTLSSAHGTWWTVTSPWLATTPLRLAIWYALLTSAHRILSSLRQGGMRGRLAL